MQKLVLVPGVMELPEVQAFLAGDSKNSTAIQEEKSATMRDMHAPSSLPGDPHRKRSSSLE